MERKYNFLLQLSLWLILKCKDTSTHQQYSSLLKIMAKILMLALLHLMHVKKIPTHKSYQLQRGM